MARRRAAKAETKGSALIVPEIRCPSCDYFLAEVIETDVGKDGKVIFKVVCRSCRSRVLVKVSQREVVVGQV